MRSEDTPILADVTNALNNLRSQGNPLHIDVRQVVVTINGSNPIRYSWDDTNLDWNIVAE